MSETHVVAQPGRFRSSSPTPKKLSIWPRTPGPALADLPHSEAADYVLSTAEFRSASSELTETAAAGMAAQSDVRGQQFFAATTLARPRPAPPPSPYPAWRHFRRHQRIPGAGGLYGPPCPALFGDILDQNTDIRALGTRRLEIPAATRHASSS